MSFPIRRFKIVGHSMEPAFYEGDSVISVRFFNIRVGDVVVFAYGSKYLVKRVTRILSDSILVAGDNKHDSLQVPSVQKKDIIGRVIWKI